MKLLSATFVCNFFLCIMHYCTDDETFVFNFTLPVALSAKIMHICIRPLSTWCLLRRTKLSPSSPSCGTTKDIFHRHSSCFHSSINFSMSIDGNSCPP